MDRETIKLAPVVPQDRAVWQDLWAAYLQFFRTDLVPEAYDAAFRQLVSGDPALFSGLIAWHGDAAVGLVHWVHHPHARCAKGAVYLQDLFTIPVARGKGIAGRLIEAVHAKADACGGPKVYWMTNKTTYQGRLPCDRIAQLDPFIRYERAV